MPSKTSHPDEHDGIRAIRMRWWFIGVVALLLLSAYPAVGWWVKNSASESLKTAEQHLKSGNHEGVEQALSWLLWFEPGHSRALLLRGISRNSRRDFAAALNDLGRIPEDSEEFREGGIALAATLIMDGQLGRSEAVLLRHLKQYPGAVESRERLSDLYVSLLCQPEAMKLWQQHWDLFPDDYSVLPRLFDIRVEVISPPQRLPYLISINEQHPAQERVLTALGRLHAMSGNVGVAELFFRESAELVDCQSATLLAAALFFLESGNHDEARSLLDRLSESSPSGDVHDGQYWHLLGRIREIENEHDAALLAFSKAVGEAPDEAMYLLSYAGSLRRLGRDKEAIEAAERAQQLSESQESLRILSHKIDRNVSDPDQFLEVSELLEKMGITREASAWRKVSDSIRHAGANP